MNAIKLNNALHQVITITFIDDKQMTGWLVPSLYYHRRYQILPLNPNEGIMEFTRSYVKSYRYLSNGVEVKWEET